MPLYTSTCMEANGLTLVMAAPCPWCSVHSPGTFRGNFMDHRVPLVVPQNNIRPECDIEMLLSIVSCVSTCLRIYKDGRKNIQDIPK